MAEVQRIRKEQGVTLKEAHKLAKGEGMKENEAPAIHVREDEPLDYKVFYHDVDKGASKPSFCYPKQKENLSEDVRNLENMLDGGFVPSEKRLYFKQKMELKKKRLEKINESEQESRKTFERNKDKWMARRAELAEKIKEGTPSKQDYKDNRVSPWDVVRREKQQGLGEMKKEFIVLSRLAEEPSDIRFLQREK